MMKMMVLFFLLLNIASANEVEITTQPAEPVVGESFNVIFKVITEEGTDPVIRFDPSGVEVLGRQETGNSTKTTYMNGKLTVERSLTIVYEMVAQKAGSSYLRNINIDLNGKNIKHNTVRLSILSRARKPKDIMAVAIVDKEEAFVGESILVRYYLYYKPQVSSTEVKKFPKLDKFLKRFHQEKTRPERVNLDGEIYTRSIIYTAQLYAEKPGIFKIDPITLGVNYLRGRNGGFGGFGFRQSARKTVSSKVVEIQIKALPSDNIPPDFTALVGKHDFSLTLNKNKFLINEPIEMKFTVKGPGALELYQSPKILRSDKLEEFDASSDFQISSDFDATKVFNITYLGRDQFSKESSSIPFSYFDPESLRYVTVELPLGEISVSGIQTQGRTTQVPPMPSDTPRVVIPKDESLDLSPLYNLKNTYIYNKLYINIGLAIILLTFMFLSLYRIIQRYRLREIDILTQIRKNGLSYGRLHNLLREIGEGETMKEMVKSSELSKGAKKHLLTLIEKCENLYQGNKDISKIKIKKSVLDEIHKLLNKYHAI
jgi:hypothetical protein